MAAVAAASIMSHGYKKNKLLPHDDDDFVLLRFAIFAFTILATYIGIYMDFVMVWYILCIGKPKDDTNTIERRPINVP